MKKIIGVCAGVCLSLVGFLGSANAGVLLCNNSDDGLQLTYKICEFNAVDPMNPFWECSSSFASLNINPRICINSKVELKDSNSALSIFTVKAITPGRTTFIETYPLSSVISTCVAGLNYSLMFTAFNNQQKVFCQSGTTLQRKFPT